MAQNKPKLIKNDSKIGFRLQKLGIKNWVSKIGCQKLGAKIRSRNLGIKNWGSKIGCQKLEIMPSPNKIILFYTQPLLPSTLRYITYQAEAHFSLIDGQDEFVCSCLKMMFFSQNVLPH